MINIEKQKNLIRTKDWDCLVILDACRFDFFKKNYSNYLDGNLRKVRSPGSHTSEWLKETWNKKYPNIVYVSANPFVNNRKVDVLNGFKPWLRFFRVYDMIVNGWSDKLGTVLPSKVSKMTLKARAYHPGKKIVTHFIQPHSPYISIGPMGGSSNISRNVSSGKNLPNSPLDKVRKIIGDFTMDVIGQLRTQKIRRNLGLRRLKESEVVAQNFGLDYLYKAYEQNLKFAFEEVKKLAYKMPDRIIVTSDHGELLGENGNFSHFTKANHPILREVPWLEVES